MESLIAASMVSSVGEIGGPEVGARPWQRSRRARPRPDERALARIGGLNIVRPRRAPAHFPVGVAAMAFPGREDSNAEERMPLAPEVVESARVPRIGPYSQAIRMGDLIFTAGQPGIDPATGQAAGDTFEAQARQAFVNLAAVLEDAGSGLTRVIKVTCFITDPAAFPTLNALFAEFFPEAPPVRSAPIVQLPKGLLFSIDAIAAAE
jgi:2-iminobutanoate/2-iminopropanoate deaminase